MEGDEGHVGDVRAMGFACVTENDVVMMNQPLSMSKGGRGRIIKWLID